MPRPAVLVATALAASLALPGCGGEPAATRVADDRVRVTLDDFSITPQRLEAEPGSVTFEVRNIGRSAHTLVLRRRGRDDGRLERSLKPERAGSFAIVLRRGSYRMLCTIANHEELGMNGSLVVR